MDLHAQRALDELERARSAVSLEAAEAHLTLSELHLREMRVIREERAPPALRLVPDSEPVTPMGEAAASG